MGVMPTPWSPFLGPPWTFAQTWKFAMLIANDRAEVRHIKQHVQYDPTNHEWRIEDVHQADRP